MRQRRYVATRPIANTRQVIPEDAVLARVLSAVRVLNAQGAVRPAGAKSSWPAEFEHVATAIKWAVWRGKPLEDKLYRKLTIPDFADIWFGETEGGEEPERQRFRPKDVADAVAAGAWFAALQRLAWNADEAIAAYAAYQAGRRKSALITDQKIITWHAHGWSLRAIGTHRDIGMTEEQVERRIEEISNSLFRIANGLVSLVDLEELRAGRHITPRHAQGRARTRAESDLRHR